MKKKKRIALCAFLVYLAVLLRITVFRADFLSHALMREGSINLSLFAGYIDLLEQGHVFRFVYLFAGNIVWFVPFGAYLQFSGRVKSFWLTVLCGLGFSFAIELLQYVLGTGYSELDDLILNTLGAGAGAAAYRCAERICVRRRGKKEQERYGSNQ